MLVWLCGASGAHAQNLPRPLRVGDLARLAARAGAGSVEVLATIALQDGAWSPAPIQVNGSAVLLARDSALALVTSLPAVAGAASIRLRRADGRVSAARVARQHLEYGLATLIPADPRFLAGLSPFPPPGSGTEPPAGGVVSLDRLPVPPGSWPRPAGALPIRTGLAPGGGRDTEAYFVSIGFVPVPGQAILDVQGRLVAVGYGRSVLEEGAVGLAVPGRFVAEFVDRVLGWPAP